MLGLIKSAWERLFSERHVAVTSLRTDGKVRHLRLSRWAQLGAVALALGSAGGLIALTADYVEVGRAVQAKDDEVANKEAEALQAELTSAQLREIVQHLQERSGAVSRELEDTRTRLASTAAQNSALRGQLYTAELRLRNVQDAKETLAGQREETQRRLEAAEKRLEKQAAWLRQDEAQRGGVAARLRRLEAQLAAASELKGNLETSEKRLQQVVAERDRLKSRVGELERRLQTASARALPAQEDAAPAPRLQLAADEERAPRLPAGGGFLDAPLQRGWGELERLLSSTGVDVAKLVDRFSAPQPAQGGPFVALDAVKRKPEVPLETIRKMMKSLPLAAPLKEYHLESRFGVRADPFNRRKSMHTGLDFSAPFKTPVYATAPGVVVYAGPKGEYGKVVDIDHGSGIVTRYAHLHRTTVLPGQRVAAHEQIGQLGSTGRSSGPHVHYEILVNGVPQDPQRFLNAGHSVLQAAATK
jgi:murein DD-endopeptidase MepM/ murein hydrolase activator NlpD